MRLGPRLSCRRLRHLEKISRHLSETFPDRFAGIHPCGQNTGEWFYLNSWERPLSGYDQATRAAFRQWLKSHGDPQANTAEPPTVDERRAHPNGLLRDPVREAALLDFARFQQQEMADHVAAMAAACRRGTDGRKLVVFFYGYLFEFPPLSNEAPASGHYALSSLLKGRDIDILCSPISYTDREWIGTAPSMTAAESVERAGILWLNEDDSRTFLDPAQGGTRPGGRAGRSAADAAGDATQHGAGRYPGVRDVVDGPAGPGLVQRRPHLEGNAPSRFGGHGDARSP